MLDSEELEASVQTWRNLAAGLTFRRSPFIDGRFVESQGSAHFQTINPATGTALCDLPAGSVGDVDRAVAAARQAFAVGRWRAQPLQARKDVLVRIAELVEANAKEFALLDTLEIGKPISHSRTEIGIAVSLLRFFAEALDKQYGQVAPTDPGIVAYSSLHPHGVVGAIVPWNYPLVNAVSKIAPAIAAGNSVVLKPSEIASLSALRFAELASEAGLPDGVLNVVPGLGATAGRAIARHGDVDFLSFTGSTVTGRRLMQDAGASNGKPLMLELGGKSAQIVCADMADQLGALASKILFDAFTNQGQWCMAKSRLFVEDRVYHSVLDAVAKAAASLVPGDPLDPATNFGTIANAQQFERIQGYLRAGRAEGATVVSAGREGQPCALSMAPTIFGDVREDMTIAREEIFGPVLCVARFSDFDEAIRLANASDYGLAATVWTRDATQVQAAARAINAGKVSIRGDAARMVMPSYAMGAEPWGASGFGVERGINALRSYSRTKVVEIVF